MTAGNPTPPNRLVRDITAVLLLLAGATAVVWAAAATDWRVLLALLGCVAFTGGAAMGKGE